MKNKLRLASLIILCPVLFSASCVRQQNSSPDLMELRSVLQRAFKEENINIRLRDDGSLSISLINSSFDNLPKHEIGIRAWQVAKVARDNYTSRKLTTVWVSFLANEKWLGLFNYTRSFGTYKFDEEQLAGNTGPPVTPQTGVVRSSYDPGRGATEVYVQNLLQLYGTPQDGLALSPHFAVPGRTIRPPEKVVLDFRSSSADEVFSGKPRLTVSVGGRVIFRGDAVVKQAGREPDGTFGENLTGEIPYRQYSQLVAAEKAKMTLGPKEIELTPEHMAALRELNRCVVNSSCE